MTDRELIEAYQGAWSECTELTTFPLPQWSQEYFNESSLPSWQELRSQIDALKESVREFGENVEEERKSRMNRCRYSYGKEDFPANPEIGDIVLDFQTATTYSFDGEHWIEVAEEHKYIMDDDTIRGDYYVVEDGEYEPDCEEKLHRVYAKKVEDTLQKYRTGAGGKGNNDGEPVANFKPSSDFDEFEFGLYVKYASVEELENDMVTRGTMKKVTVNRIVSTPRE